MVVGIAAYGGSNSARALKEFLEANGHECYYRHHQMNNVRTTRITTRIINWGISSRERLSACRFAGEVINPTAAVNRAADKQSAFNVLRNAQVSIPDFTVSRDEAMHWTIQGHRVYCRTQLRGNSGDGIVVARNISEVVNAPLYVKGLDVAHEYRFHVMDGVIIDAVRKSWSQDVAEEDRNMDVRNHANGSIFVRGSRSLDRALGNRAATGTAIDAVRALGLTFGAVDLIETTSGEFKVLEVNTACGLEGTTLERYGHAFLRLLNNETPESVTQQPIEQPTTEGTQTMELTQGQTGLNVIFHGTNASITTLTQGNQYVIESVGNTVFRIRNDRGDIRGYRPEHFQLGSAPSQAPLATFTDTSLEPTDPLRVIELEDGTFCNPGGTVTLLRNIDSLRTGDEIEVTEVRCTQDLEEYFIGITHNGDLYFFPLSFFEQGNPVGVDNAVAPIVARDLNGRRLREGNRVIISGPALIAGSLGTVASVSSENQVVVTLEQGGTETFTSTESLRFLTNSDYDLRIQRRSVVSQQESVDIQVGTSRYRVLSRDLPAVQEVLRRFTV